MQPHHELGFADDVYSTNPRIWVARSPRRGPHRRECGGDVRSTQAAPVMPKNVAQAVAIASTVMRHLGKRLSKKRRETAHPADEPVSVEPGEFIDAALRAPIRIDVVTERRSGKLQSAPLAGAGGHRTQQRHARYQKRAAKHPADLYVLP